MLRVAAAVLVLAACKQAHDPPAGSAVVDQARELADKMCACKDRACGVALQPARDALLRALPGATFTDEQVAGLAREDQRLVTCMGAIVPH